MSVSAATLAAPTGLTATDGCSPALLNSPVQVTLNWTATTSTWATNQEVLRATSSGGPYTVIATVSRTATSYVDSGLNNWTTYHYRVRATRNLWVATSGTASATTKGSVLCALL
jgi:cellulose 1,4-beta-cellobiosidase